MILTGRSGRILCTAAAVLMMLTLPHAVCADDDDEAAGADHLRPQPAGVQRTVQLPLAQQQVIGLEVENGKAATLAPETAAFGTVVDLRPLLDLLATHNRTQAERDIARASLNRSRQELERVRALHRDGANISTRELQDAEAAFETDRARERSAEQQLEDERLKARQSWGKAIADDVFGQHGELYTALTTGREVLVLVTLPPRASLPDAVREIYLSRSGARTGAVTANRVSAAPLASETAQGETWFFRVPDEGLRTGMRVQAWIPSGAAPLSVVQLPASAIVWHEGKPWVYVRRTPERFERVAVTNWQMQGEEWLIETPSLAGQAVVTVGAQTLLAEEYRWRIPDEDDNP